MNHIVSPLLFSQDRSHVLLVPDPKHCLSPIGHQVNRGEGFRSAATRIIMNATNIVVDPAHWKGFYSLRLRSEQNRLVHFFTSVLPTEEPISMELKLYSPVWVPVRSTLAQSTDELLDADNFNTDVLLAFLIPLAIMNLRTGFRNLGY